MNDNTRCVYALVGPKGAGKTYLGRLAERELGIKFVDVEAIALALPEHATTSTDALYDQLEHEVANALAEASEVILEVTGASPGTAGLFENLRQRYILRLIQIVAPLETCLARVEARDSSRHLPTTPGLIREVHARSMSADFPYDLQLENSPAQELNLIEALQSVRPPHLGEAHSHRDP